MAAQANTPQLESLIDQIAKEEGMDPSLLRAVVKVESAFDANAISPKGAVGLMQLMPDTARDLGVRNRYNPEQNLRGGAKYLRQLLDQFSSLRLALAAYNAGPGAVGQYGGIPPYAETRQYVHKVLASYGQQGYALGKRSPKLMRVNKPIDKTIYRYRGSNGALVLTDKHPMYRSGDATANAKERKAKERAKKQRAEANVYASLPKPKGRVQIIRIVNTP